MGRHRPRPLTPEQYARLLEVAVRRVAGQQWAVIAADMGWRSKQAAEQWAHSALARAG